MEVADAEAEAGGRLEAAARGVHADCRRSKRVVRRKHEGAPVLAILVGSLRRTSENVVPPGPCQHGPRVIERRHARIVEESLLEDIRLGWVGYDVGWSVLLDILVFSSQLHINQPEHNLSGT